jgi:hypothetical protein
MRASLLFIVLLSSFAQAEVYRHVEPDGMVVFSDKPQSKAEVVNIRPIQIVPATKITNANNKESIKDLVVPGYSTLSISSPAHDETIPNGAVGTFNISGLIEPSLKKGHSVVLQVDGKRIDYSRDGANFTLKNVDRGTHILQLQITDAKDEILKSSKSIDIHVQRASKK